MGCEGMSEAVAADPFLNACFFGRSFNRFGDTTGVNVMASQLCFGFMIRCEVGSGVTAEMFGGEKVLPA